jgi:nitroreductase
VRPLSPARFVSSIRALLAGKPEVPPSLAANPVLRTLLGRRSIRSFRDEPIPDDVWAAILECGRLAPSTVNLQSWSFGLFDRDSWRSAFGSPLPFKGARAILMTGDMHRVRAALDEFPFKPLVEYTLAVMNASIAAYAMNVAAEACGVGSVMLSDTGRSGFYDARFIKERLALPDGVFPLMTIVFGYARRGPGGMPPKLPTAEITFAGSYREADTATMKAWLDQMTAGYRATHVTSSFRGQLRHYLSKIDEAEAGLRELIYYRDEEMQG